MCIIVCIQGVLQSSKEFTGFNVKYTRRSYVHNWHFCEIVLNRNNCLILFVYEYL